jgi:hypothetical protein
VSILCIAAMILISLAQQLNRVRLASSLHFEDREVSAFVEASSGPASVERPLSISWVNVSFLEQSIHYRLERAGMLGDIALLVLLILSVGLLGVIGITNHRTGEVTPTIRIMAKMLLVFFGLMPATCMAVQIIKIIQRLTADTSFFGVKIPRSLELNLQDLFGTPLSTQPSFMLSLLVAAPLVFRLAKLVDDDEATV